MKTFKELMNTKMGDVTMGDGFKISLVISSICSIPALVVAVKEIYDYHECKKSLKKSNEVIEDKED